MPRMYSIAEPFEPGTVVQTPTGRVAVVRGYTKEGRANLRYTRYPNDSVEIFPKYLTRYEVKHA